MKQPRYHFYIDYGQMGIRTTKPATLKTILRYVDDELESHRQAMTDWPEEIKITITRDRSNGTRKP
jgi:hypothetical protein